MDQQSQPAKWRLRLQQSWRQDRRWLPILAALYGAGAALVLMRRPHFLTADAVAYLDMAGRLRQGDLGALVNAHWSPLWPAFLALCFLALPTGAPAAHAAAAFLSLLLLGQLYVALAVTAGGRRLRAFWVGAMAAAVFLTAVYHLTPDLLQALFALPFALALYLAFRTGRRRFAVLAGLLGAALYLSKCFGFPWALAAGTLAAGHSFWWERKGLKTLARINAVYLAAFLALAVVWMAALRAGYGHWMICLAGKMLTPGTGYARLETGQDMTWAASLVAPYPGQRHFWDDPGRGAGAHQQAEPGWDWGWLKKAAIYNAKFLGNMLRENPVVALAVCGLLGLAGSRARFHSLCAWLAALWVFGYALAFFQYRYLTPALPLLFFAAAGGSERLWLQWPRRRILLAAIALLLAGAQVKLAAQSARGHSEGLEYDRMILTAAALIRGDDAAGTVAADRMEESLLLAYYADRVSVNVLGPHSPEAMQAAARHFHIRYLLWRRPGEEGRRAVSDWVPLWSYHGPPGDWVLYRRPGD
jgi:hypothetical protein